MATRLPVRERIFSGLATLFEKRASGVVTWDVVTREAITDADRKLNSVLSIVEGSETSEKVGSRVVQKEIRFSVEFEVRAYQGDSYAAYANSILADVQQTIGDGVGLIDNAIYINEVKNTVDAGNGAQKTIGGIAFYELAYRHVNGDPTRAIGEK